MTAVNSDRRGEYMTILFVLWAGLIPAVPLFGAEIYRKREDKLRTRICYALFFLQLIASAMYIIAYFKL
ncbi:MAG: hypothetical protein J1E60_05725 [Christensenellaceae bacterium]|nr:hypothetical protein [Christensenellaceae bacterium]